MADKMERYLRKRENPKVIYPWTEILAQRKDLEEVYARTPNEARGAMPLRREGAKVNFNTMTRAQLLAYASNTFDERLPATIKHSELVAALRALEAAASGDNDGGSGDNPDPARSG